jgi:hypothetical protein
MDPPVCRTCGKKHWSRVCTETLPVTRQEDEALPVAQPVTLPGPRNATPKLVAPSQLNAALAEVEALRAEVVVLKKGLATSGFCPECERRRQQTAERVRRSRTKKQTTTGE